MSYLDSRTILGHLVRLPLKLIPSEVIVPVLSGPMRGMWWVVGSAPHGAWLGTLERDKLKHFIRNLKPNMIVWDIGSNVGLYTLPSARILGSSVKVYAFEPFARNLSYLKRHVAGNGLTNITVVPVAVGEREGFMMMAQGSSPSEFHADTNGDLKVPSISLDSWREETDSPAPHLVKIDVEGAEAAVLRGAAKTFSEHRPIIYLALHGEPQRQECQQLLTEWGYELSSLEPGRDIAISSEWLAEPKKFAATSLAGV